MSLEIRRVVSITHLSFDKHNSERIICAMNRLVLILSKSSYGIDGMFQINKYKILLGSEIYKCSLNKN